jgi:peptide-methionine (S)-S-oxide reductase
MLLSKIPTLCWEVSRIESSPGRDVNGLGVRTGHTIRPEASIDMEQATFGAGCFWGVEETFRQIPGVASTAVGYSGGTLENPTYEDVCTDRTEHAEVVRVQYDPSQVSYESLLDVFWKNHDPTTPNRQGPDHGSQYRSVILYHSPQQQAAAVASKEMLQKSGRFSRPIVTQIVPAATFWRAEEYHQRYLEKRGMAGCRTH